LCVEAAGRWLEPHQNVEILLLRIRIFGRHLGRLILHLQSNVVLRLCVLGKQLVSYLVAWHIVMHIGGPVCPGWHGV
jgi:hypothetical protein